MTPEELDAELVRVVYFARDKEWKAAMQEESLPLPPFLNARLDRAARLAIARHSAEKQRANGASPLWMDIFVSGEKP